MRQIIRKSLRGVKGRKFHETEDQEISSGVEREEVFKRRAGGMLNRGRLGVKRNLSGFLFFIPNLYHLTEQKFLDYSQQMIDKVP